MTRGALINRELFDTACQIIYRSGEMNWGLVKEVTRGKVSETQARIKVRNLKGEITLVIAVKTRNQETGGGMV